MTCDVQGGGVNHRNISGSFLMARIMLPKGSPLQSESNIFRDMSRVFSIKWSQYPQRTPAAGHLSDLTSPTPQEKQTDNKQQLRFFRLINNSLVQDYLSALGSLRNRNNTQKSFAESYARGANFFLCKFQSQILLNNLSADLTLLR